MLRGQNYFRPFGDQNDKPRVANLTTVIAHIEEKHPKSENSEESALPIDTKIHGNCGIITRFGDEEEERARRNN